MRGFTLIEVVMYLGLFALLIGGAALSAYQLVEGGTHTQQRTMVEEEGAFLGAKIRGEIENATSALVLPDGALALEPGDVTIWEDESRLDIARGPFGASVPLSSAALAVSGWQVQVSAGGSSAPSSVEVQYAVDGAPFSLIEYLNY